MGKLCSEIEQEGSCDTSSTVSCEKRIPSPGDAVEKQSGADGDQEASGLLLKAKLDSSTSCERNKKFENITCEPSVTHIIKENKSDNCTNEDYDSDIEIKHEIIDENFDDDNCGLEVFSSKGFENGEDVYHSVVCKEEGTHLPPQGETNVDRETISETDICSYAEREETSRRSYNTRARNKNTNTDVFSSLKGKMGESKGKRMKKKKKIEEEEEEEKTDASSDGKKLWESAPPPPPVHKKVSHRLKKRKSYCSQYLCDVCGTTYSSTRTLEAHLCTHSGMRPFKCPECPAAFRSKSTLKEHGTVHSGTKPFACDVCGMTFARKTYLRVHMPLHYGEKPHGCHLCSASFSQSFSLNMHLRTHTGEQPHQCGTCAKAFSQKSSLRTHMRLHSGEKPFQCAYCDSSFTTKGNLQIHHRKHTGEKPYCCDRCSATFSQANSLKVHMRTHTGEKPYRCRDCSLTFITKGNLDLHKRTHSD